MWFVLGLGLIGRIAGRPNDHASYVPSAQCTLLGAHLLKQQSY
jgi:hypothetical protein